MGLTVALGRQAGIEIWQVGGLRLVSFADAQIFLDACLAARVLVLGLEGFTVDGGQAQPNMNAIADFSQLTKCEQSVLEARAFIETTGRPEMLFDFTLSDVEGSHK